MHALFIHLTLNLSQIKELRFGRTNYFISDGIDAFGDIIDLPL